MADRQHKKCQATSEIAVDALYDLKVLAHLCAVNGSTGLLCKLIECGVSVNAADEVGLTPLHFAAGQGHTQTVLELIHLGAEKAMVAGFRGTPLHQAAGHGHVSTVKAMLKEGCPVDMVASNGCSVLHAAADSGNAKMIRVVLKAGCDINATCNNGMTSLHLASQNGKTEVALELIRHGADKAIVAGACGTPLHQAAYCGHVSTVKALLKVGCPVDVRDSDGGSVLHAAAVCGNAEMIREVCSMGCNINETEFSNGLTPLHRAAEGGHTEAALELIILGAEKAVVADRFGTPLHITAGHGHVPTVKAMLKAGCPVDVVDSNGASVLHSAAHSGNVEVIREVLSTGCDINRAMNDGRTPLHVAAGDGKTEATLELIRHGAEKTIIAGACGTPLHHAAMCGHVSTVKTMLKAGCPVDLVDDDGARLSVLYAAAKGGSAKVIQVLVRSGCDINGARNDGWTPLHVAAADGKTEAALELIRQGAEKAIVADARGTPLHQAAVRGHVSTVKAMLKAGCPVDVVASNCGSILHAAAQGGDAKVIRVVLSTGFDINAAIGGITPLHVAAREGKTDATLELIRHGANKAIVADIFCTPLHLAAVNGHASTVKAMLKAGCPLDVKDGNGISVLHDAAVGGNAEVIREICRTGLDINATCNDGRTALHVAATNGKTEAALELIRHGADKAIIAGACGTPLHQAAGCGHVSTVKALLTAGCPVDVVDSNGLSVLHFAAQGGSAEVTREVCSTGCDINAIIPSNGETPLHRTMEDGHTEAALELIRFGAKKAIVADGLGTPLHLAAKFGHESTVKALLKAGCPVNVVDNKAASVLHAAAEGGTADIIRDLLSARCDINLTNNDGQTPLHVAAAVEGKTEVALELIQHGAEKAIVAGTYGTPLHQAAACGHVSTVKVMLKEGCRVDIVNSNGYSVLHAAALGGSAEVIRELCSVGCDINVMATSCGQTPLHRAVENGHTEAALELIRLGAEKAIIADRFGTPLHVAVAHGHVSTVKAMLRAGCPVDVLNNKGVSVLHAAAENGFTEIVGELLSWGCDVCASDNEGNTPLGFAAITGHTETVLELVRHGADKNTDGGTFGSPIISAAGCGHWVTVQAMIEEGFPLDGVAKDGSSLVHLTACRGNVRLLRYFAKIGLNVSRRNCYGLTPLHYALLGDQVFSLKALIELGADVKAEAPLLGTPLDVAGLRGIRITGSLLGGTILLPIRKPDEMIVDFALCKELGINIQSPYLFSEHGGTIISVFEYQLFHYKVKRNLVRVSKNLRNVLSIFSKHQLVDQSKLACLAAIHGDVQVLECLSEILTAPTEPCQLYERLKQLFPIQFRHPESILQQVLPKCELNPLQLAIVAMMCNKFLSLCHCCLYLSSCNYTEVIGFLTTNDSFRHTLNKYLPNGLTPLDLAEKLGLDKAVDIISNAGGIHGIWSNIPEEVKSQYGSAFLLGMTQLASSGSFGQQAVQAVLSQLLGRTTTTEQGTATEESHLRQQKVLEQRPELSIISTYVIDHVNVERWRRLGISLKIPLEALTDISSTHSSCEDRYLEVLIYWLGHNEAASWRTLLEVIGHFETKHTMDQLTRDILGTQDSEVPLTSTTHSTPYHLCPVDKGPTPPSSVLSPQFVSHVVHHVGVNWYNFALHLGISSTVLDVIKVEKQRITGLCCCESLHRWLRHDHDTGGKRRDEGVVLEAVKKTCGPVAVERIQSSLRGSEVTPSSPTPLLQSTPELAVLQEHVVPFTAAQWEAVADYLLVSYEKRAAIAASEQGRVEVCCRELFNQWLQQLPGTGSLPRTWGAVLDVVGEAVGPEVAKQIRARLDSKEGATPTLSPLADPLRDELLHSKPTAVLLLKKVIPSVAHKWHQLRVHLGIQVAILKTFKVTESHDVKLCCLEMFECWMQESRGTGESPRTWSTVLSAVGDCLGRDVADNIERALLEERRQRKQ